MQKPSFSLFHNGFITNFKELTDNNDLTDSEVIASLIDARLKLGQTLGQAIRHVCEIKLYGTWRLVILGANSLFITTNSGDFYLAQSVDSVKFSSEALPDSQKLKQNWLYEVNVASLQTQESPLVKKLELPASKDFYLDEIRASVNTVQFVTDFGAKFVTSDTVCLGGFDKAKEELILIKNLVVAAHGSSLIAAEYGAFILKYL